MDGYPETMINSPTFIVHDKDSLKPVMLNVWNKVKGSLAAGPVVVTLSRESKSRDQEAKYHAMISDFSNVEVEDRMYEPEIWKALLVDAYAEELKGMNEPLTHPGNVAISLDGRRAVTVRPTTTKFLKKEASGFIEFLYATGTEYGVVWSEKAKAIYREYREAG